ncbi:helix-turn-helix domain-containing protein [Saccharothrix sp. Mg75]|uniref:helix-turn-helix domain-containing protein n=1 Tax=Saccharothrix sp. Mg75 TaxID=3445357 RepID=UPI003EEDA83A
MGAVHGLGVIGRVLKGMAADEDVVDQLVREARSHAPDVARLPEAENRRHVAVMLAAGLDSFTSARDPDEQDFTAAEALGSDRAAQGVPIAGLLRGVQAGRTRATAIAISRCREAGVPDDVILEAILDLDRYTGALERHVISGYHTAELELSRTTRDTRTLLLRRLLLRDGAPPPADDELRRAGLRPDGRYHCLVSAVTDPVQARALEERLLAHGGVCGIVEGRLTGLAPHPPAALDTLVVAAPAVPLDALHDVHHLCAAALRVAADLGLRGVRDLTELAGETALAAHPVLAGLLGDTLLAALDHDDEFHRELVCTALAYLDHDRRLSRTAAFLHVHPNTVRYRLDRLEEVTGTSTDHPAFGGRSAVLDALRWWWALRTWLARHR